MSALPRTAWIWRDGSFVPWEDATLHVMSHVIHYGSSVFEGIRCYRTPAGPALFRLHEHVRRLFDSARVYRMEPRHAPDTIADACAQIVTRNGLDECYLRPIVLRGLGSAGVHPGASPVETFIICWPWGAYLGDGALERGVDVCVSSWTRPAPNTIPAAAKAGGGYLSSQLIKMEAVANGYDEGIALSVDGLVAEGSGQNLFVIRDGVLLTPPANGSLLAGLTREAVLTIARDLAIEVAETALPREMLYTADEIFFTGTAAEVTPVRSVDRITVGTGAVGPLTIRLQQRLLGIARGSIADAHGWLTLVPRAVQKVPA